MLCFLRYEYCVPCKDIGYIITPPTRVHDYFGNSHRFYFDFKYKVYPQMDCSCWAKYFGDLHTSWIWTIRFYENLVNIWF